MGGHPKREHLRAEARIREGFWRPERDVLSPGVDEKLLGLVGHEDTDAARGAVGREANVSPRIHARPRGILGDPFASNAGSVAQAGDVSYLVPLSTLRTVA